MDYKQSACQISDVVILGLSYYKYYDTCIIGRQENSIKKSDNFKRAKVLLLITSVILSAAVV